jgi:anaerobic magnesium-protoporphyrin IX monomethyl ester cyclase
MMPENGMDVVLLFAPSTKSGFTYNLGIGYLAAYLKDTGFSVSLFLADETDLAGCTQAILSSRPKIVGFSVLNKNYVNSLLIARSLKQAAPSTIVLFGGPTPTVNHRLVLENSRDVDICVRGEGEEILLRLLQYLRENGFQMGEGLVHIKGISYVKDGMVRVNDPADILLKNRDIKNYIDNYPSPYLSGIIPATQAHDVGIVTARGCNQNCVYCNCAVLYHKHVFTHSVDRILEELGFISDQSASQRVSIFDDAFTIFPERAERICKGIIAKKIDLRLTCITRCDRISEGLLDLMKAAGFESIAFSLESAVPRILRALGKVHPAEDIPSDSLEKERMFLEKLKKMASHAKKIGMNPIRLSIMVGLPSETPEEARRTIQFLEGLDYHIYAHNLFSLFEATPVFPGHEKYGYQLKRFSKNQLMYHTTYPFRVSDIPHARNSVVKKEVEADALDTLNVLGLTVRRGDTKPWFDHVIVTADILSEPLIQWFKENLAFNGKIIQIYSGLDAYRRHLSSNYSALFDQCSPSTQLTGFYRSETSGGTCMEWIPGRSEAFNKGPSIKVRGAADGLGWIQNGNETGFPMICREFCDQDSRAVISFLKQSGNSGFLLEDLASFRAFPVLSTLCRWHAEGANCRMLETAIIDDGGNIRVCWHGDPVGKIPMHKREIMETLGRMQAHILQERGCSECPREKACVKCFFTAPLNDAAYCRVKQDDDILEPAGMLKSYYLFKDVLNAVFQTSP